MQVNSIGQSQGIMPLNAAADIKAVNKSGIINKSGVDTVSFKGDAEDVKDKQEIMKSACKKAAGWAIFGSVFSTAYYALRSNKTIANKYNLDPEKDKKFISRIKEKQMLWTLPSLVTPLGAIIAYFYCSGKDSETFDV
ncbi:MAG: hypothetical protein LBK53_03800 [Heliobacteriaceae bacterium]|jgi:Ni2+-binding GTPase involved in maturation of urease and hydrogenase|nr:hypothetical protein [Heliobacteriaceae bacterium]